MTVEIRKTTPNDANRLRPKHERVADGLAACLAHPDGRFFIANLIHMTGVYAPGPDRNEAIATYLGRRSVGVALLSRMAEIDDHLEPKLMMEMRDYDRALRSERSRNHDDDPDADILRRVWSDPDA